jgi:deoxyhypusine synthase
MSKYRIRPYDMSRTRTHPLRERTGKVTVADFGRPHPRGASVAEFLEGFPAILGAQNLRELAHSIARARDNAKPILWGLGGHVIKTGLSPILIDLMDRGLVSGIALNGSGIVHDFEIAIAGSTSEDVEAELPEGNFGMAEETGQQINQAISEGVAAGLGIGEALGQYLAHIRPEHSRYSLILQAWARSIPVTVHVTIGADIIHNHPAFSPSDVGEGTHRDFRIFASLVASLNEGGVFVNCGSAVTLPEVFLKCITLVRNSGDSLRDFTTANLDFIQHYRPTVNVIKRPVQNGGRGIAITGHHEILIPLLAAWLVELSPRTRTDD